MYCLSSSSCDSESYTCFCRDSSAFLARSCASSRRPRYETFTPLGNWDESGPEADLEELGSVLTAFLCDFGVVCPVSPSIVPFWLALALGFLFPAEAGVDSF